MFKLKISMHEYSIIRIIRGKNIIFLLNNHLKITIRLLLEPHHYQNPIH